MVDKKTEKTIDEEAEIKALLEKEQEKAEKEISKRSKKLREGNSDDIPLDLKDCIAKIEKYEKILKDAPKLQGNLVPGSAESDVRIEYERLIKQEKTRKERLIKDIAFKRAGI